MKSHPLLYFVTSTLVLLLLSSYAVGESSERAIQAPKWTRAVNLGGDGPDISSAVQIDTRGDQYVTGGFCSTARFGNKTFASAGGSDIFLAKFGPSGELLWLLQAGGPGDDVGERYRLGSRAEYLSGWFIY